MYRNRNANRVIHFLEKYCGSGIAHDVEIQDGIIKHWGKLFATYRWEDGAIPIFEFQASIYNNQQRSMIERLRKSEYQVETSEDVEELIRLLRASGKAAAKDEVYFRLLAKQGKSLLALADFIEKNPTLGTIMVKENSEDSEFEAFLSKIKKLKVYIYKSEENLYIENRWTVGGECGGSCWDTGEIDNHRPIASEPEPEFTALDTILEIFCPCITFLQYKNLVREVVKYSEKTVNDYYSNYTVYGIKKIDLKVLFDTLKSKDLLGE